MLLFSSFSHVYVLLMFVYLGLLSGIIFFAILKFSNKLKTQNASELRGNLKKELLAQNKRLEAQKQRLQTLKTGNKFGQDNINQTSGNNKKNNPKSKKLETLSKIVFNVEKVHQKPEENRKEKNKQSKKKKVSKKQKKLKDKKPPNKETLKKINNLTKNFLTMKATLGCGAKKLFIRLKYLFIKFKNLFLNILNIFVLSCLVLASYYVNFVYNMGHLRFIYVVIWVLTFLLGARVVKMVAKLFFNFYNKLKQKSNLNKQRLNKIKA